MTDRGMDQPDRELTALSMKEHAEFKKREPDGKPTAIKL
jgi:hypothetical protein